MNDLLKQINSDLNKGVQDKLITEMNVPYVENDVLENSCLPLHFREKLLKRFDDIVQYLKRTPYDRVEELIQLRELLEHIKWQNTIDALVNELNGILSYTQSMPASKDRRVGDLIRSHSYQLKFDIENVKSYALSSVIIINGDGATGKTHLLTKFSNDFLKINENVITFYGQNVFDWDNLISFIEKKYTVDNLFETMNTDSKLKNSNGLVIFDAINELKDSSVIAIIEKLLLISKKSNLKLIISYRNGDLSKKILKMLNPYPQISLYGFRDNIEAAIKFGEYYGIDVSEILEIDFASNPLILKMFCEAYNEKGTSKGTRGKDASTFYFERYYVGISKKIINDYKLCNTDGTRANGRDFWNKIAKLSAKKMVTNKRTYVSSTEIKKIISNMNLNETEDFILDKLVLFKLLEKIVLDYETNKYGYKFSFQKQSDYIISRYFMNAKPNNVSWPDYFKDTDILDYLNHNRTILESLVDEIPIRTKGHELYEYITSEQIYGLKNIYLRGLKFRSKASFLIDINQFKKNTFDYLKIEPGEFDWEEYYNMIASCILVPYHPFNMKNYEDLSNISYTIGSNEKHSMLE